MYEGWTTEVLHAGCATCDEALARAYGYAVGDESSSHNHQITDDQGDHHWGTVRRIEDEGEG